MATSPFGSWNGIESHELFPGVRLKSIGGAQVVLCLVTYEPGKRVLRHAHEESEQVMAIVDGEVTMTVEAETRTLRTGDVAVVNRGLQHELYSEGGVIFYEALAPVLLDHVPDPERDLVGGGSR